MAFNKGKEKPKKKTKEELLQEKRNNLANEYYGMNYKYLCGMRQHTIDTLIAQGES